MACTARRVTGNVLSIPISILDQRSFEDETHTSRRDACARRYDVRARPAARRRFGERHGHRRTGCRASRRDRHADRKRPHPDHHDGCGRQVPLPESGARHLPVHAHAVWIRDRDPGADRGARRRERRSAADRHEGRRRRGNRDGDGRVAHRRQQGNGDSDQLHVERAAEGPDFSRSVRADAQRARRARRPRQHRRQRDRPAVELSRPRARGRRMRRGRSTVSR